MAPKKGKPRSRGPLTSRRPDPSAPRPLDPSIPRSVVLPVHVQPRAARTEVGGLHGDAIKIRLRAPPVDGAANEELVRFVAARLGIPRAAVEVLAGATGRRKLLRITGAGDRADAVRDRLLGSADRA